MGVLRTRRKTNDLRPVSSFHIVLDDRTPSVESTQGLSAASEAPGRGPMILTDEGVKATLHDFYDNLNSNKVHKIPDIWRALFEKYHTPSYTLIRPSGNPLTSEGFVQMHCSVDVEVISMTLISIDSTTLIAGAAAAVTTYTVDQIFLYKGTRNEDRCVVKCVL
jgi:hypothetical protein